MRVVNLSEGWGPAGKPHSAQPLQVVNLSEGCGQFECGASGLCR